MSLRSVRIGLLAVVVSMFAIGVVPQVSSGEAPHGDAAAAESARAAKIKHAGSSSGGVVPAAVRAAVAHGPTNVLVSVDPTGGLAKIRSATRGGLDRKRRQEAVRQSTVAFGTAKRALLAKAGRGVSVVRDYDHLPAQLVKVDSLAALDALAKAPGVSSVSLPRKMYLSSVPSDLALIHQPEAAQAGYTGRGVSVAILDTGIDYQKGGVNGPFGNCSQGIDGNACRVDWFSDTTNTLSIDPDVDPGQHGTNVAGIVAETAPDARLDVYRVFRRAPAGATDCRGNASNLETTTTSIMDALNDVVQQAPARNIRSVNMSLGGCYEYHDDSSECATDEYAGAFLNLRAMGVLPVVAAGNDAVNQSRQFQRGIATPACDPGAVSVGAVYDHQLASSDDWEGQAYCNPGSHSDANALACFSQYGKPLSLLAPGVKITAAGITESGTSQATPHVAAAVADLVSANPSATAQQIVQALTTTGPTVTDPRDSSIVKHRLDIAAAAQAVRAADPPAEVVDPACTANTLPANDDSSTGAVSLPFVAQFFGTSYSSLYVNNNGNVTFQGPQSTYTPFTINADVPPMIAPFFADVDTRGPGSGLATYGSTTYGSRPAFCVNWNGVGYFGAHTDKTNSFQLLLVDRGDAGAGDFDIVMNYNAINWETGDASGGNAGFGGSSAGAGYSAGDGAANHFFQFEGSLVHGGLVDFNSDTGLVNKSRGVQTGRHIFPVRNGAPPGAATIKGVVRDSTGQPQSGSPVQACPIGQGGCIVGFTGPDGRFTIVGVSPGDYDLTARPAVGSRELPAHAGPLTVATGSTVEQDLTLTAAAPLPAGTTITDHGSTGGVPVLYWNEPLTLQTTACAGGSGTYSLGQGATTIRSGSLVETPSGSGRYGATIDPLYPNVGDAAVSIRITCPDGTVTRIDFTVYIDPSGTVVDTTGAPLPGATVTLLRSESVNGPFTAVPDGSAILSPSARSNPETTGSDGVFHWDVIAGFYQVSATKAGCHAPGGSNPSVTSPVYEVPPPALGISLTLDCGENTGASSTSLTAAPDVATVGRPVLLTATVGGSDPAPTGTITFADATGPIAGCANRSIAAASATCTFTPEHATSAALSAAYSGDARHPASTGRLTLRIDKATPALTWPTPDPITYPSALGTAQLNATADVAGTFSYTVHANDAPASGTVLHPGSGQLLDVAFTPTNTDDMTTATAQVALSVLRGAQAITVDPVASVSLEAGTTTITAHGGPSGLSITFTSTTPGSCTVGSSSGSDSATTVTVTLLSAGPCTLTASQAGNGDWAPAADAGISFTIAATAPEVRLDASVAADQKTAASKITSPALSTAGNGELLLALVSADGPATASAQSVKSLTGGGLTWALAARSNKTYGTAEIWQAWAPTKVTGIKVIGTLRKSGFDGTIQVAAFQGTRNTLGARSIAAATSGVPRLAISPSSSGSLVWAVGHNWNTAQTVTPVAGQTVGHQFVDQRVRDTYWTQSVTATTPSRQPVTVGDIAPGKGRWQLAAVEIAPAVG